MQLTRQLHHYPLHPPPQHTHTHTHLKTPKQNLFCAELWRGHCVSWGSNPQQPGITAAPKRYSHPGNQPCPDWQCREPVHVLHHLWPAGHQAAGVDSCHHHGECSSHLLFSFSAPWWMLFSFSAPWWMLFSFSAPWWVLFSFSAPWWVQLPLSV